MAIITVSGNLGSGGQIGQIIAQKLGFDYVDSQTLIEASGAMGVSDHAMLDRDESSPPPTLRERLAASFENFLERSAAVGAADPLLGTGGMETLMATTYREAVAPPEIDQVFSDACYKEVITSVMKEISDQGNVVIIGRGGQAILRDHPRCLHVRMTAPFAVRVHRIAEREGLSMQKATERVTESDKARLDYHRKYFEINPADPDLYDIIVNTAYLSQEDAAELITPALRLKLARKASPA